ELLAAALRDRAAELGLVVGEVQKGARGGELLAHEQQRRLGREQQQRRRGAVERGRDEVGEPLAQGAVADLVVVLGREDEGARRRAAGPRGTHPAPERRKPSAVQEAVPQRLGDLLGAPPVVPEVALALAGQERPERVVEVVGPDRVEAEAAAGGRPDQPRLVAAVLGDQDYRTVDGRAAALGQLP